VIDVVKWQGKVGESWFSMGNRCEALFHSAHMVFRVFSRGSATRFLMFTKPLLYQLSYAGIARKLTS